MKRLGGNKNYDYLYAWVRDVAYTIKAFLRVGATEEAKAAFSWLTTTIQRHEGDLRTLYSLDGGLAPDEQILNMPGCMDSRPVRLGNKARDQLQLGIYGDVMMTASLFVTEGHVLDLDTRGLLGKLAKRCADLWSSKDSGIWELEQQEHYTTSKIGCWAALDQAMRLAAKGQIDSSHIQCWKRERDKIRDWIDKHCWSESEQSYTKYPGTDRLDASILLATRFGFERSDRLALSREAVRHELCRGPLVYRYSGAEKEEGTFVACGFWLVEAFALLGDRSTAIVQMDAMFSSLQSQSWLIT